MNRVRLWGAKVMILDRAFVCVPRARVELVASPAAPWPAARLAAGRLPKRRQLGDNLLQRITLRDSECPPCRSDIPPHPYGNCVNSQIGQKRRADVPITVLHRLSGGKALRGGDGPLHKHVRLALQFVPH